MANLESPWRHHFPILGDPTLTYVDSGASSQKPDVVIDAMSEFYRAGYANIHRGLYPLSVESTARYEQARTEASRLIGAKPSLGHCIITKGFTQAWNMLVQSWGGQHLAAGDVVVLSLAEHHSNIVPWQMLAARKGIQIRWWAPADDRTFPLEALEPLLTGAKVVSVTGLSNVLGTGPDIARVAEMAHQVGASCFVDACQLVAHQPVDVAALGVDALAFSAHKICGPSGIGILWATEQILSEMPPWEGGGDMISSVTVDGFAPAEIPQRFEAGTPPIAEAVGFAAAARFVRDTVGLDWVEEHGRALANAFVERCREENIPMTFFCSDDPATRSGIVTFELRDALGRVIAPHDVAHPLAEHGICVRAGHHCAQPLVTSLTSHGSLTRASFYLYNNGQDVDRLVGGIQETVAFWSK